MSEERGIYGCGFSSGDIVSYMGGVFQTSGFGMPGFLFNLTDSNGKVVWQFVPARELTLVLPYEQAVGFLTKH